MDTSAAQEEDRFGGHIEPPQAQSEPSVPNEPSVPTSGFGVKRVKGPVASKVLDAASALEGAPRLGKDVAALVEHPFATLSLKPEARTIMTAWETRHPASGETLRAEWRVEGSPQFGLPTATDERVYLVLMELTREQGLPREVSFTRYALLSRLGWATNRQESYGNLREAFQRLASVTITSQNVLWDARTQAFYDTKFSLIDNYEIYAEPAGRRRRDGSKAGVPEPQSIFKWNDVIHQSMATGQIRTLDLGFALSLEKPASLRLLRFLDKKSHDGKKKFEIELHRLCELHLGMTPAFTSQLKQRLEPAHDELKQRGFLAKVTYGPMKTKKGEKVSYCFPGEGPQPPKTPKASKALKKAAEEPAGEARPRRVGRKPEPEADQSDQLELPLLALHLETSELEGSMLGRELSDPRAASMARQGAETGRATLARALAGVGVSERIAGELLSTVPAAEIALQLSFLADRAPKDPAATLVAAVRQGWGAPPASQERLDAAARRAQQQQEAATRQREEAQAQEQKEAEDAQRGAQDLTLAQERLCQAQSLWQKFCALPEPEQAERQARLAASPQTEWLAACVARKGGVHALRQSAEQDDGWRPTGPLTRLWVDYMERCSEAL